MPRKFGVMHAGVATLDGFVESLRLLIEREQYALTDIGPMFGISRERVRQLAHVHGITIPAYPRGLYAERVWDDTLHRFIPVSRKVRRHAVVQRKTARHIRHMHRQALVIDAYINLSRELQHPPTLEQWASRLRGKAMESHSAGAMIVTYWRGTGEMQVSLRTIRTIAEESKP